MNKKNLILVTILVVQIIVLVVLIGQKNNFYQQDNRGFAVADESTILQVTEMTVIDGENKGKKLTLKKSGSQWIIRDDVKASNTKIKALFEKIQKIRPSWAVATSEDSHRRFEVSDDDFQRKISLKLTDKEIVFFLGTSPGYRQIHARIAGSDNVYAVRLNAFDFSSNSDDWLDATQLQVTGDITAIKTKDYQFNRTSDTWTVLEMPNNTVDKDTTGVSQATPERAETMASALKTLQLISISDQVISKPLEQLNITTTEGEVNYLLYSTGTFRHIQKKGDSTAYGISKSVYDKLLPKVQR